MSLRLIAQNLGLSITTVSRALGGFSDVSRVTRDRVVAEAERIRYVPNEVARRLQKGRADAIGLVLPAGPGGFEDPFFLNVIEGAWERASALDIDLLVLSAPHGPHEMRAYRRLVEGRRVDGLILTRLLQDDQRLEYLKSMNVPFVAFAGLQGADPHVVNLQVDERMAVQNALEHLTSLGHRQIGFLSADSKIRFVQRRAASFKTLCQEYGVTGVISEAELNEDGGYEATLRLLARKVKPTALIAVTDPIGVGAARAVRSHGMEPGRDISIICMGDSPMLRHCHPAMTAIRMPTQAMAGHAVEILLALRDGLPYQHRVEWPSELVVRESTGPARVLLSA